MAVVDSYAGIIFDYGGVLAHHQTEADQVHLARIAGLAPEQFSELYWAERPDYDKGLVTGDEYWQQLAYRAATVFTPKVIEELTEYDTVAWMQYDDRMFDWVEELKGAGKRVAILSNMPLELGEAIKSRTQKFDLFDQVTLSYEVGSVKPEPAIYEHCILGMDLPPREALFLDDRLENVHGAERLGINAIRFTTRQEMLPQLTADASG